MEPPDDHAVAARIAADAGRVLSDLREARRAAAGPGTGDGARALGRDGDRRSHDCIMTALAHHRPDDDVLSEEGPAHRLRPSAQTGAPAQGPGGTRLWVVDPLDGTREYGEGRADFAVHVALVVGGEPVAGAVALPAEALVFSTGPARPDVAPSPQGARLRIAVSRTRPPAEATRLAAHLDAELVPMGSAGAKTMAVVRGQVDAYVHGGGQYEWDSAAPVAVARAYGAHASRLDGSALVYGRPDPWLPDLVVCRADVAAEVGRVLGW